MKKIITLLVLAMIAGTVWFFIDWWQFLQLPLLAKGPAQVIRLLPGTRIEALSQQLTTRKLLKHPQLFLRYAKHKQYDQKLRYGEYWIKPGMTAPELLQNIVQGRGLVEHKITFIEGWTFRQIKRALNKDNDLQHDIKNKTNAQIMALLGHPHLKPEGRFFPDTFLFAWGSSDLDVLKRSYALMQRILTKAWAGRLKDLPYQTAYKALIVASLIEKETAKKRERPMIAGVIARRLKIRMRLQVDPTVLYGVGKPYGSTITKRDLRAKNPFNTYYIYGLPPTPIDSPSKSSIIAAMHPQPGKYLYYVANGDGSHVFSVTYRQHLAAIRAVRLANKREQILLTQEKHWRDVLLEASIWLLKATNGY